MKNFLSSVSTYAVVLCLSSHFANAMDREPSNGGMKRVRPQVQRVLSNDQLIIPELFNDQLITPEFPDELWIMILSRVLQKEKNEENSSLPFICL